MYYFFTDSFWGGLLNIKQKLKLLSIIRYVVECNGSQEVLNVIDNDIDYLHEKKKWTGGIL